MSSNTNLKQKAHAAITIPSQQKYCTKKPPPDISFEHNQDIEHLNIPWLSQQIEPSEPANKNFVIKNKLQYNTIFS